MPAVVVLVNVTLWPLSIVVEDGESVICGNVFTVTTSVPVPFPPSESATVSDTVYDVDDVGDAVTVQVVSVVPQPAVEVRPEGNDHEYDVYAFDPPEGVAVSCWVPPESIPGFVGVICTVTAGFTVTIWAVDVAWLLVLSITCTSNEYWPVEVADVVSKLHVSWVGDVMPHRVLAFEYVPLL